MPPNNGLQGAARLKPDVRRHEMTDLHSIARPILSIAVVAYVYGAILGAFAAVWEWLFREGLPSWEWWQYLLAPLGIGFVALALEGVGTLVMKGDDVRQPLWKRSARVLVVFLILSRCGACPGDLQDCLSIKSTCRLTTRSRADVLPSLRVVRR